jgi:hypothetical protein
LYINYSSDKTCIYTILFSGVMDHFKSKSMSVKMHYPYKALMLLVLIIVCLNSYSQKVELYGGPNISVFRFANNDTHFSARYSSDLGYSAGIGLDGIKADWLTMRFSLQIDKYGTTLNASYGGLSSTNSTDAITNKTVISLAAYPVCFRVFKRMDLNFGLEYSRLVHESFSGTASGWGMTYPAWSYKLEDKFKHYSAPDYFGLRFRIGYNLFRSEKITITPEYSFYYGLKKEFTEFPEDSKSMRNCFCIGIKMDLK